MSVLPGSLPDDDYQEPAPRRRREGLTHRDAVDVLVRAGGGRNVGHAHSLVKLLHDDGRTYEDIIGLIVREWGPQRGWSGSSVSAFHAWCKRKGHLL